MKYSAQTIVTKEMFLLIPSSLEKLLGFDKVREYLFPMDPGIRGWTGFPAQGILFARLPIPMISGQWLVRAFVPFTAAGQREDHLTIGSLHFPDSQPQYQSQTF